MLDKAFHEHETHAVFQTVSPNPGVGYASQPLLNRFARVVCFQRYAVRTLHGL